MKKILGRTPIYLAGLCFWLLWIGATSLRTQDLPDRKEMEEYLKRAAVVSNLPSIVGRTKAWVVELDDGEEKMRGFFKHVHRPRPKPLADSYTYELAAYTLDKLLDLYVIPPMVEREIEGFKGSLQMFLEDCEDLDTLRRKKTPIPNMEKFQDALDEILVVEVLANDECRDAKDTMVHTGTWKPCRIDFSMAFDPVPNLNEEFPVMRCSRRLYERLKSMDDESARTALAPYLNPREIEALFRRRARLLERLDNLIKERGEDAVLYDF